MPKAFAPAADRNQQPILEVLQEVLPPAGFVLEVASGTGQHAAFFAEQLRVRWQPSDVAPEALASVRERVTESACENLLPPIFLDVVDLPWPVRSAHAVVCINMIHVAPWKATVALFRGSADLLESGGRLITYGPYSLDGQHTSESNAAFDQSLRARNPEWGVRDVTDIEALGDTAGFLLERQVSMPANNMTLVWTRRQ